MKKPSKYIMPNAPRADLRAIGKHLNPYYYPIDREPVPVMNSPISDPTEIPSSSEKTPEPTETLGETFINSHADPGLLEDDEKSLFGLDRAHIFKRKKNQLLAPVDRRKRSFLHSDILKEANSHLRRLQSGQLNPGNLEDWDWRGKEVSIMSKKPSKKPKKPRKPLVVQKIKTKYRQEETRENRLPYHHYTSKPKYMAISEKKPFCKQLHCLTF